jgi:hypothetical protein
MKCSVFRDITLYTPLKVNLGFGGTCYLNLQDVRTIQAGNQVENRHLRAAFMFGLFFRLEDKGYMFL